MGCVAANVARLARHLESSRVKRWRRWAGRQGGRVRQYFLEIELNWENHEQFPPQRRAGPFRFRRWGSDQPMGSDSSPRSFGTSGEGGARAARMALTPLGPMPPSPRHLRPPFLPSAPLLRPPSAPLLRLYLRRGGLQLIGDGPVGRRDGGDGVGAPPAGGLGGTNLSGGGVPPAS